MKFECIHSSMLAILTDTLYMQGDATMKCHTTTPELENTDTSGQGNSECNILHNAMEVQTLQLYAAACNALRRLQHSTDHDLIAADKLQRPV